MAGNQNPIWARVAAANGCNITAANTKSDGTGTIATDIFKAFTADATNGSYVEKISINAVGTTASTASAATVFRVFLSSKTSGATTPGTDTFLLGEISAAAQTTDSPTTATYTWVLNINRAIPPGWTILVSSHAAPNANTAFQANVTAGDY